MGGWLARLKNEKVPNGHATKPTKPQKFEDEAGFVGFVAPPQLGSQKNGARDTGLLQPQAIAANNVLAPDISAEPDPDRWCWPHSPAMNTHEIDDFIARQARFTDKGVGADESERLADKLVIRDREGDDRRLCLECAHLQGFGPWRCGNWRAAGVGGGGLARDLVLILQRCDGFSSLQTDGIKEKNITNAQREKRSAPQPRVAAGMGVKGGRSVVQSVGVVRGQCQSEN